MNQNTVEHTGIVKRIEANRLFVEIVQQSACSDCHAKMLCAAADSKTKEVEVANTDSSLQVGDAVIVQLKSTLGFKAVRLAFIYPAALLLVLLFLSVPFYNEALSALLALGGVALYYGILSLFGKALKRKFIFELKRS